MYDFIVGAGGLAAAAICFGAIFLYQFCVRHWRDGGEPGAYSPTLAAFTTMIAVALPLIVYFGTETGDARWSLVEAGAASFVTFVALKAYTASAPGPPRPRASTEAQAPRLLTRKNPAT